VKHETKLACALLCCTACGGVEEPPFRDLSEPRALDEHVVWFDRNNDEALLLDVGTSKPEPELDRIELPAMPRSVVRRNGQNQLLVLLSDEEDASGKLAVLGPSRVEQVYEIGAEFDALQQSEDGRWALAYFSPNRAGVDPSTSLLFNPNEIAIVDLEAEGEGAVVQRTLRSLGSVPRRVEFSPPMTIAGETRRLVVVFFEAEVTLIDLNHLDRPEYTIELSRGGGLGLTEVRFSPEEQRIYLLADGSSDVFVLRLLEAGENRENDFEPSLNQLGTDSTPRDMVVFENDGERKLLVASSSSAQVVESSSNRVTQIPLENPGDRILLFEGASPFDDEVEPRALLYRLGSPGVTFLDLDDIEERTTRNREEFQLAPIASLVPLENNQVLANHDTGGLSILNLEERTASPIQAQISLAQAVPSLETSRIWVAPTGQTTLGFVDLANLHPGQVRLDLPIANFLSFENTSSPKVVVTHPDAVGAVSILSAANPGDGGRTLYGFLQAGVLDR
jgi:hypothetical protein